MGEEKSKGLGLDPFRLGDWTVHPIDGVLSRGDLSERVEPRVMSVLVYLAERAGDVVLKDDILATAWSGQFVEEAVLSQCVYSLRKALGDDARSPSYIATVPRRGYRVIAEVTSSEVRRELPSVPSIVVLPFENLSPDEADRYLSSGITTELITKLTKLRDIFVIGQSSALIFQDRPTDPQEAGRQLGVRYVVSGAVQKLGDRVRVHAQLVDTLTNRQLWGERFDRIAEDIFAIQEEIAEAIVTELDVQLMEGEQARFWRRTTESYQAYETYLRGLAALYEASDEGSRRGVVHFDEAVALDPSFAQAWALKGVALSIRYRYGWAAGDEDDAVAAMRGAAEKAIELDESLPAGHTVMGLLALSEGRIPDGVKELRRAIELGPGASFEHATLANLLTYDLNGAEALEEINTAIRLSPYHPHWYLMILGDAYRLLGRFNEALDAYRSNLSRAPGYLLPVPRLISTLVALDRTDEAKREAKRLKEEHPSFSPKHLSGDWGRRAIAYRDPAERERLQRDLESVW